mmetsp:Transcript_15727/g.59645  ORF Transcript_15727/g.59645 Transcript_15727/m.59645 type:complete len:261 (-) Transcript_15727:1116-1898(-)
MGSSMTCLATPGWRLCRRRDPPCCSRRRAATMYSAWDPSRPGLSRAAARRASLPASSALLRDSKSRVLRRRPMSETVSRAQARPLPDSSASASVTSISTLDPRGAERTALVQTRLSTYSIWPASPSTVTGARSETDVMRSMPRRSRAGRMDRVHSLMSRSSRMVLVRTRTTPACRATKKTASMIAFLIWVTEEERVARTASGSRLPTDWRRDDPRLMATPLAVPIARELSCAALSCVREACSSTTTDFSVSARVVVARSS